MIKPIKFIPGDIVLLDNKKYIITRIFEDLLYFVNIKTGIENLISFSDLNNRKNILTRIDYIGPNFNDDFLCHNCFPSKLAGCVDCCYKFLIKSRKQFFCPGDKVHRPNVRKTFTIKGVELAIIDDDKTAVSIYYFNKLEKLLKKIDSNNITEEDRKNLCHLFSVSEPSLYPFYAYNKLRLIKRTSYRLNKTQLNYICNDICIYGEGSKECESCETGILKKNLKKKNDI